MQIPTLIIIFYVSRLYDHIAVFEIGGQYSVLGYLEQAYALPRDIDEDLFVRKIVDLWAFNFGRFAQ
jgi:hypothetical protein